MGVDVAGGACLGVSRVFRNHHQRGSLRDQKAGVSMPLWYNKDKENAYYPTGALAPRPGAFYQQGTGQRVASFGPVSNPPKQTGAGPSGHLVV